MDKIELLKNVRFIKNNLLLVLFLANESFFYYFDFFFRQIKPLFIKINNLFNNNKKLSSVY